MSNQIVNGRYRAPPLKGWQAIALGTGAIFAAIWLAWMTRNAWQMRSWPEATATIESLEFSTTTYDKGHSRRIRARYVFDVDHTTYQGENFDDQECLVPVRLIPTVEEQYAVGATGPVKYNPQNPAESYLNVRITLFAAVLRSIVAAVAAAGGVVGLIYGLFKIARGDDAPTLPGEAPAPLSPELPPWFVARGLKR